MKKVFLLLLLLIQTLDCKDTRTQPQIIQVEVTEKYQPTWDSLDKRPLPSWYDDVKVGIFIHWGVFSVPSVSSEWFWYHLHEGDRKDIKDYMKNNYPPNFTYQDFAKEFKGEFFNVTKWAQLFKKSGAKYVVLTSKHHEGYTLWPSKYSYSWNSMDIGLHRDVVGELAKAVRKEKLHYGVYHSLYEWFNPLYIFDKSNNFTTNKFVENKCLPELKELVNKYEPEVIWSDGDWETNETYWQSKEFLAWLYNDSPVGDVVVVNDRWGTGTGCKHGDFYNCADRYNPGKLMNHKWENAMTLDKESWGFRRNADILDYLTTHELLVELVSTISYGGNILINVGPTKEGVIAPIFEERLINMGIWLKINGEGVYGSKPCTFQNDTLTKGVYYTCKNNNVYSFVTTWPCNNTLSLKSPAKLFQNSKTTVTLLGNSSHLKWHLKNGIVSITFPDMSTIKSSWIWTLKITSSTYKKKTQHT